MFSTSEIQQTYDKVYDLLVTRHIIKTYSTNKDDIRDVALRDINLTGVKRILELGCGYGFFVEKLKDLLDHDAVIFGIDLVEKNREPFLNSVASCGYRGEFICNDVRIIMEMKETDFDLIIASYSLYFFPDLIPHMARLLNKNGSCIILTHSMKSLDEALKLLPQCMKSLGFPIKGLTNIQQLFNAFSGENGYSMLKQHFSRINKIEYINTMVFSSENINDCIYYLVKKRALIYKEMAEKNPDEVIRLESCLAQRLYDLAKKKGFIKLNKNDVVFRCMQPLVKR